MKIEFLKKFYKDLDKITTNNLKSDLMNVILEIEKHKDITEIKNMIKMKNSKNAFRIKLGDYRIGVYIEKNTIEFARFAHRKDIYKMFP